MGNEQRAELGRQKGRLGDVDTRLDSVMASIIWGGEPQGYDLLPQKRWEQRALFAAKVCGTVALKS